MSRAVAILRLLGKSEGPQGVTAIAGGLGLVPSSALRLLRVLVAEELVHFDSRTKRYSLDAGILALARSVLRPTNVARVLQPELDRLSRAWGLSAAAVQLVSLEHIVIVAVAEPPQPLRVRVEVGSRFPALMSATGLCVAAFSRHPRRELERRLRDVRWQNPPSLAAWRTEVEATRRRRYSVDEGRYMAGFTAIAAPILDDSGSMSHAIVVLGVREQVMLTGVRLIGEELGRITESLSAVVPSASDAAVHGSAARRLPAREPAWRP